MSGTDATGQSEVDYVNTTLRVHEDVGRFHVTMHDICTLSVNKQKQDYIEIVESADDLVENVADMRRGPTFNGMVRLHDLLAVPASVLLFHDTEKKKSTITSQTLLYVSLERGM